MLFRRLVVVVPKRFPDLVGDGDDDGRRRLKVAPHSVAYQGQNSCVGRGGGASVASISRLAEATGL